MKGHIHFSMCAHTHKYQTHLISQTSNRKTAQNNQNTVPVQQANE